MTQYNRALPRRTLAQGEIRSPHHGGSLCLPRGVVNLKFNPAPLGFLPEQRGNALVGDDMRDLRVILISLMLCGVIFCNSHLQAQSVYGQIQGYLTGEAGKPVKNAVVTVSSTETQAKYKVRTNESGYFVVNNLVPSHYDVLVQANGYKTVQTLSLPVGVDSPVTINGTLPPGDSHVIVSGPSDAVSMLQIDRAEVSTFFDARTLATLPVLDRNVTLFQLLVPSASSGKLFIANLQNPQG